VTRRRQAFTLIEMLTVIMVLAILVSLIMPGLSRTRERARAVSCVNRLGQLSRANLMYVKANDFEFPDSQRWVNGWGWYEPSRRESGTLWKYTNESPDIYVCPTAESRWREHPSVKSLITSKRFKGFGWTYSINERCQRSWQGCRLTRFTKVKNPEGLGLFADENAWTVPGFSRYTINNGALGTRKYKGPGREIDCIGTFHYTANDQFYSGRGNISYVDGHASTHWVWESEMLTTPEPGSCN
jgi:prepilin-type N-terminal cleavage/methylation domain-containing protein/prepilin-type processing-associated H-X9-DG protein